jgi:hypothetical protein
MHIGKYFWGIVLVLLGGLLLAQNLGLISPSVNVWSIFWALLLVALGVSMLARNLAPGWGRSGSAAHSASGAVTRQGEAVRLPLGAARQARVNIHHGAGELRIDANAAPDELLSGTFVGGLEHQERQDGDELVVDLRVPSNNIPMVGPFGPSDALNWTVGLNPNVPLALRLEVGANRNLLNLRDLQVKELHLQTGASATEIDMPARAGEVRATLRSGAASVVVRIPENVSAQIRTHGGLSSVSVDTQRFPQVGEGDFRSPDYGMAANRIDLDVETGVGSFRVS